MKIKNTRRGNPVWLPSTTNTRRGSPVWLPKIKGDPTGSPLHDYPAAIILGLVIILCLIGCGSIPSGSFHSALEDQPYVVNLAPSPYQFYDQLPKIEVSFSKPIDPTSVTNSAVFVVEGALDPQQYADSETLQDDLDEGKLQIVEGIQTLEDLQKITWESSQSLTGGEYSLVVTPDLKGEDQIPFNQEPGQAPTNFIAVYRMEESNTPLEGSTLPGENPSENPTSEKIRPDFLLIHEVLYDAVGSDTDGNEFIELYGSPNTDISGYQVVLVNGADGAILENINIPDGSLIDSTGIFLIADTRTSASTSNVIGAHLLDNFDPQNGPDALQLLDDQGHLVDALAYGTDNVATAHNGLATGEGNPALDVAAGHSLSRIQGQDTNDNAADFVDLSVPTPGVL